LVTAETQPLASKEISEAEGTLGAVERSRFRERQQETALQGESCSFGGTVSPAN
jgi:hypothetical protein